MFKLIVRWTARISAVLIAVAFFAFAAGEPMGSFASISLKDRIGMALLLGAIVSMVLAWKWELPAALVSLFALGAFTAVVHMNRYEVMVALVIPNLLFLMDWKLRRSHSILVSKTS
ncbi:MAG: hypothetical protein WBR26_18420 [Candidatus Acidiferrum sp.]